MADIKLISKVNDVLTELDNATDQALTIIGLRAERHAKAICPVDTGRLRNSISYATSKAQGGMNQNQGKNADSEDYEMHDVPAENTVVLGTNVSYAVNIELGGSKGAPQGFLRPALANHLPEYEKIARSVLKGED